MKRGLKRAVSKTKFDGKRYRVLLVLRDVENIRSHVLKVQTEIEIFNKQVSFQNCSVNGKCPAHALVARSDSRRKRTVGIFEIYAARKVMREKDSIRNSENSDI